jgi:hypothetical protein
MDDSSVTYDFKGYKIRGWFKPKKYPLEKEEWYLDRIKDIKGGTVVEVGVFGGASLLTILDLCKENGNKVFGIDPWELLTFYNGTELVGKELADYRNVMKGHRENLEYVIGDIGYDHVELIQEFSIPASDRFEDESIDLLYLDGNHSYKEVVKDLNAWLPKIKKGSSIIGDDWGWKTVRRAVNHFAKETDREVHLSEHNIVWEIVK